ncbi:hypothetical protein NA56DRAFT_649121 [Hyaloscypha hepaticicola]|uniref:Uncharacterized protein n=1 Tax=Hyaloscypha hepaticicola TaxID=2082293 RepID=A0A2J6PS14_9HELO|nr:hypothetical protein NA56DRAFT_649121 [Hyaloscypha hepaticicola]
MPGYLEQEDSLSSGSTTILSTIPESITKSALPPSSKRHQDSKLYWMDCCQCGGRGMSRMPYPQCESCYHHQCDACDGNT